MSEVGALEHILDSEDWKSKQKHVFILSSAGKPVYSRYGSEEKLVTLFGVMQALVSVTQDMDDDSIEAIYFGSRILVFSVKGPIILVAVSSTREPLSYLNKQLSYVYSQIVSVLTLSQVTRIFEERRNYDLRRLLTGSERLIDSLLKSTELEPDLLINGVSCLPLPLNSREAISNTIISTCSKIKNLVFVILVAGNKLITLVRMKKYHISPSDLHLVFNMVNASESFKTAESWTPICLPNFDSSGFLHCHVSYLTEDCNACLLLFTVDRDLFFELSDAKKKITEKLKRNNLLTSINDAVRKIDGITASLCMAPVRHFIYKDCRSGGVVSPSIAAVPYENAAGWAALMKHYQILYDELHSPIGQLKLIYRQFSVDTIIAWPFRLHRLEKGPLSEVTLTKDDALKYYKKMALIRRMENSCANLYKEKAIRGFCHLYAGQEAVAVGIHATMRPDDCLITAYRAHAWCVLMGTSPEKLISELCGRVTGTSRGKGGSMHTYGKNFFGGNGIVGAQVPLGTGVALMMKLAKKPNVTVALYGDGAANQGQVFESYNIAKLWNLPVIFVCENNKYGMGTSVERATASTEFYTRGDYIPGIQVDGMDVLASREASLFALAHCISNRGPILLEMVTYRYFGHSMSDPGTSYRTRDEIQNVRKSRDPLTFFKDKIVGANLVTEAEIKQIDNEAKKVIDDAVAKSKASPKPAAEELFADVYKKPMRPDIKGIFPWQSHKHLQIGKPH